MTDGWTAEANEALRDAERRYRELFADTPAIVHSIDREGRLLSVSNRWCEALGYAREEVLGRRSADLLAPESRRFALEVVLPAFFRTGACKDVPYQFVRKDGTILDVLLSAIAEKDPEGKVVRSLAVLVDVGETRRVQRDHAALVDAIDGIVWEADPATFRFLVVSKQAERILGYPAARWLDEPTFWVDHLHPDDRDWAVRFCRTSTGQGRDHELQYRMLAADGREVWLHDFVTVTAEAGRPKRLRGVMVDVTARKRAEEGLRRSEEEHRQFFEMDLAGNYVCGPDGRLLRCNAAFARVVGCASPEEALALGDGWRAELPAFLELLRRRDRLEQHESTLRRGDGRLVHVVENAAASLDAAGALLEVRGHVIDDSRRRHAEEQLRQAQKLEALGRLAGGVAHDFNNLLTVILTCADALQREAAAGQREDLEEIRRAGQRAADLTRQLLVFGRKQAARPQVLDPNGHVRGLQGMLRRLIGEDVELVTELAPDAGHVRVDPAQLDQVVVNLVVNARDALPAGGRLVVATSSVTLDLADAARSAVAPGPYARLTVTDTGVGMGPDVLACIFEPFYTTKDVGHGTGLGLSVVYGIARQAGGTVRVESAPGHGSTFEVLLPRVDEAPAAAPVLDVEAAPRGGEAILLAEDEEPVRLLAARALRGAGYEVLEAGDGAAALRALADRAGPLHLLVTDVVMPVLGGPELAARVRGLRPAARVLFMSGYGGDHPALRGAPLLQKPFTERELLARVRRTLDEPS